MQRRYTAEYSDTVFLAIQRPIPEAASLNLSRFNGCMGYTQRREVVTIETKFPLQLVPYFLTNEQL